MRILNNAIVTDDGSELEKLEESKRQLEKLGTEELMNQISLRLKIKIKVCYYK